jgi:hydroxyacylglutathione hydrolase
MTLAVECVPALSDNYIWLIHDPATGATAAIDPAEAAPVRKRLAALGWRLTHILNTHHHGDHTGGNLELKREFGCRIVGAAKDAARIPGLDDGVADGDTLPVGSAAATVLEVPGHTIGHIAFHFAGERMLFCGDTLFSLGCGRMFEGNPRQFWTSLARLRALPPDTSVYCAHEYTASNGRFARTVERDNPALLARIDKAVKLVAAGQPSLPSTIGEERAANPFLRADIPAVARAVGLEAGADPVAVFAELRRRKDVF